MTKSNDSLIDRLKMVLKRVEQIYPEYPEDFAARDEAIAILNELIAEQHPTPDRVELEKRPDETWDAYRRRVIPIMQAIISQQDEQLQRREIRSTKGGTMTEETSKKVSSKAGRLLGEDLDAALTRLDGVEAFLRMALDSTPHIRKALEDAKSVAASALTQAEDKKLRDFVQQLADGEIGAGRARALANEFVEKENK